MTTCPRIPHMLYQTPLGLPNLESMFFGYLLIVEPPGTRPSMMLVQRTHAWSLLLPNGSVSVTHRRYNCMHHQRHLSSLSEHSLAVACAMHSVSDTKKKLTVLFHLVSLFRLCVLCVGKASESNVIKQFPTRLRHVVSWVFAP